MKAIKQSLFFVITTAGLAFTQVGHADTVRFEYRIVSIDQLSADGAADTDRQRSLESILNQLGSEGWELPVGTGVASAMVDPEQSKDQRLLVIPPGDGHYLLLKRQVVVPAK